METALWAEADRMRRLAINQDNLTNQQGDVKKIKAQAEGVTKGMIDITKTN